MRHIYTLAAAAVILFNLFSCGVKQEMATSRVQYDTSFAVYGPYSIIRLNINKGIRPANPVQLARGDDGYLYAANQTGEVYTLRDTDNDGLEDTGVLYCNVKESGLRNPGSLAFRGDTVYVGTAQQIRVYLDHNKDGAADTSWVFFDDIPTSEHPYEYTSGLTFGPDKHLYFALSTDSWNAGSSPDPRGYRGAILRISPDGKKVERVATGIRSVYSMRFAPDGKLFFVDNEGGGNSDEELNMLVPGSFYGHNKKKYGTDSATGPVYALKTELAPSGMVFNTGENDFGGTRNNLFISFYGPGEHWNHGAIARLEMQRNADGSYMINEIPVADIPKLSAITFGKDGSLYAAHHGKADYWYNAVYPNEGAFYKIVYNPEAKVRLASSRKQSLANLDASSVDKGKLIFAERACSACHGVDGTTELLGPDLSGIARQLSRTEILHEIENPSDKIKPSMMAVRVTRKDGSVLLGRSVNVEQEYIELMLVGNHVVKIAKKDIAKTEDEPKSLMYANLIKDLSEADRDALLDYITSLSAN